MFRILFSILILFTFQNAAFAEEALPPPLPEMGEKKKAAVQKPQPKAKQEEKKAQNKQPENPPLPQAKIDAATYQKVMTEYRAYLLTIPKSVREEIRNYRKEVIRINKEKTALYKQLSSEAQKFLKTERDFKKRLPLRQRKKVTQATSGK